MQNILPTVGLRKKDTSAQMCVWSVVFDNKQANSLCTVEWMVIRAGCHSKVSIRKLY